MKIQGTFAIAEDGEFAILTSKQKEMIRQELERIFQSEAFRSSPRCKQFLRFVVEHKLEGHREQLKERTIGIEVFGRKPSYLTEGDSVVRVRATEVRRRLTEYYATPRSGSWRILLSSGSYIPQFLPPEAVAAEDEAIPILPPVPHQPDLNSTARRKWYWLGLTLLLVLMSVVVLSISKFAQKRQIMASADTDEAQLEQFWLPAIQDSKPVLICIGSPTTYTYSGPFQGNYMREHGIDPNLQPQWTIDSQKSTIPGNAIIPVKAEYVGAGDANLAVLLSALFAHLKKPSEFRLSENTSYTEISDAPTVLIGAFSNRWTLQSAGKDPFFFAQRGPDRVIEERDGQHRRWTPPHLRADGRTGEDFALVSRMVDSETGKFLVTAAGISGFGSRAAGYFLTRPELLSRALRHASSDWSHKNLQFVLETRIVDDAPTAPEVVAWRTW
jgi:hypothetical protein